ncbi:MAG: hexosaminidase [Mucilaginibacter sp.]|nr:hexosaminidase [Mucilaginibacter sp.]
MKKALFLIFVVALPGLLYAQDLNLIPYPKQVKLLRYNLLLAKHCRFYTNNSRFKYAVDYLNGELAFQDKYTRAPLQKVLINRDTTRGISGAYTLNISGGVISIQAPDSAGVFNGIVTLLQLYRSAKTKGEKVILPGVTITDQPRYQWRGFMLDESRHFFGKEVVKKTLKWMAFYKLNRFHWHLTDAQGWRLEVKRYHLLATTGGIGNFTDSLASAKYYTQDDIKEIIRFAKQRNIEIVPEIDMPGHATAANHAYPLYSGGITPGFENFTFNPGKEITYSFISNILKEVKEVFPGNMIHIGGDEVTLGIKAWENNPDVKRLMNEKGFTDYKQAEFYFLKRIADTVQKLNCRVMCWDEAVAAGLPTNRVVINWWRQDKPAVLTEALRDGYKVILCPRLPMYFDFVQDSTHKSGRKWGKLYNSYINVYHFPENSLSDTVYSHGNIIGLQANLWTETVVSEKRLDYLLFPRLAALAESGWTDESVKDDRLFNERLRAHLNYYTKAGIYYYDPFNSGYHKEPVDKKAKQEIQD